MPRIVSLMTYELSRKTTVRYPPLAAWLAIANASERPIRPADELIILATDP